MPPPEVGFELLDQDGRVAGEAELAWPERRIAMVLDEHQIALFEELGWRAFTPDKGAPLNELR
ncbi:MAG: hypothetical protein IPF49_07200 [Gammaproteobacteria bacterium]|nr:hypothetical protein [Gammaproteobacteria bacterium]